jgi:hypothetical protein
MIFACIKRAVPLLIMVPCSVFGQVDLDIGLSAGTRVGFYNNAGSGKPLAFESDGNRDIVAFHPTRWKMPKAYGFGYYMDIGLPGGWAFGIRARVWVDHIHINGYSDYTDAFYEGHYGTLADYQITNPGATQTDYDNFIDSKRPLHQHPWSLINRTIESVPVEIAVSYRWHVYKSFRPFVTGSLSYGSGDETVINRQVDHPHFDIDPDFFNVVSQKGMLFNLRLGGGFEYRATRLSLTLSAPINKLQLFSSDDYYGGTDAVSLPYSRVVYVEGSVAQRLRNTPKKETPPIGYGGGDAIVRQPLKWQFGVLLKATMNDVDDIGYLDISSTEIKQEYVGNWERDRLYLNKLALNSISGFLQPFTPGLYGALHRGKWYTMLEAGLHPVNIRYQGDLYYGEFYELPNGSFFYDNGTRQFTPNATFQKNYLDVSWNLKAGFRGNGFGGFIGAGYHYWLAQNKFRVTDNINPTPIFAAFNQALDNTYQPGEIKHYINDDLGSLWEDYAEEELQEIQTEHLPLEKIGDILGNGTTRVAVVTLGFTYSTRRISASCEFDMALASTWKGRSFFNGASWGGFALYYTLWGK